MRHETQNVDKEKNNSENYKYEQHRSHHKGEWNQLLTKGKYFLCLIKHPSCN